VLFDLSPMHALPYRISLEGKIEDDNDDNNNAGATKEALIERLKEAKKSQSTTTDSPLFQLVEGFLKVDHTIKTEIVTVRKKLKSFLLVRLNSLLYHRLLFILLVGHRKADSYQVYVPDQNVLIPHLSCVLSLLGRLPPVYSKVK
jgi:hypothetical protein